MTVKSFKFVLLFLFIYCGQNKNSANFQEQTLKIHKKLCMRINSCFSYLSRTLSKEYRKKITTKNCLEKIRNNLSNSLNKKIFTLEFQKDFFKCHKKLLKVSCNEIIKTSYFSPSCIRFRKQIK